MTSRNEIKRENIFLRILRVFLLIILFPVLLVRFVVLSVRNFFKNKSDLRKIAIFSISQIDSLSGVEFEDFLTELFKSFGFATSTTKVTGDYGADLILSKGGKKCVVQAKRYSKTVGISAVQQIIGAKNHYFADDMMVVTNNYFSAEAKKLGQENNVKLIDRDTLTKMLIGKNISIKRRAVGCLATEPESVMQIERRYPFWI